MSMRPDALLVRLDPRLNTLVVAVLAVTVLVASTAFGWLTYRELHGIIMDGFDRKLSAVSTTTAAFIDPDDHARILERGEEDALYLRYVVPMRRIMAKKGLTYLYSYVPATNDTLVYVLDATEGDGHSHIGDEDPLPAADAAGVRAILRTGEVYLSGMQAWEQWGILKSAYAPIRDPADGHPAVVGADIDISIITTKTGNALARVGAVGVGILFVGHLVTLSLSRRLAAPLAEVKDGALRVAAGELGYRLPPEPIEEFDQLATCFNEMSSALQSAVQALRDEGEIIASARRQHALRLALEAGDDDILRNAAVAPALAHLWQTDPAIAPLQPLRTRREAQSILRRVIASGGGEDDVHRWLAPYLTTGDPHAPEGIEE